MIMAKSSKAPRSPATDKPANVSAKPVRAKSAKSAPEPQRKREKLVRDSFTIPKGEYAMLATLKARSVGLARPAKKSELIRAGVASLAELDDAAFLAALKRVPAIKTGRPAAEAAPAAKANKSKTAVAEKN